MSLKIYYRLKFENNSANSGITPIGYHESNYMGIMDIGLYHITIKYKLETKF